MVLRFTVLMFLLLTYYGKVKCGDDPDICIPNRVPEEVEEKFFLIKNRPCEINPCQNGGVCKDSANGYHCFCPDGVMGDNCQLKIPTTTTKPTTTTTKPTTTTTKPTTTTPACQPTRCSQVKKCFPSSRKDGEYTLWLMKGGARVPVSVFCHRMASSSPKEYITLKGNNYALSYEWRGRGPNSCAPMNFYAKGGKTTFSKVRLLPKLIAIDRYDFTFAKTTSKAKQLHAFGNAADCVSKLNSCRKGEMSINLSGTRFLIDPSVKIKIYGPGASILNFKGKEMPISNPTKVKVNCGGYCGYCEPTGGKNMKLKIK